MYCLLIVCYLYGRADRMITARIITVALAPFIFFICGYMAGVVNYYVKPNTKELNNNTGSAS